jgi:predicted nucleic acid-binding protein
LRLLGCEIEFPQPFKEGAGRRHPGVVAASFRPARFIDVDLRVELLDQFVSGTMWFEPAISVTDCRDPTDNKYLELALAAQAATIVSSDQDLLVLQPWRGSLIERPAEYLAREAPLNP